METKLKLFFGVFIASWSSIIIRWIGPVDPLIISFYRLFFSSLLLLPFIRSEIPLMPRKLKHNALYVLLAGLFLALHFYSWITSLQLTTVGNSIFLESTHPIFGLLLSMIFLKERASKSLIPAFILGILGMYLTVSGDVDQSSGALLGDLLALGAALFLAAYLLIARMLTQKMTLLPYLFFVYSAAALFILILILVKGLNFWHLSLASWMLLLLLAAGPNLIGHSLLNWASRRMPVFKVNMALLSESVLATFYAAVLLNEIPETSFYFGAACILASMVLVFVTREKGLH